MKKKEVEDIGEKLGMQSSWLVQRLMPPAKFNPVCFGGGLKNGGLSDEAMESVGNIFSFDSMGAAEFEYGAVPEALQLLAKTVTAGEFTCFEMQVKTLNHKPERWMSRDIPGGVAKGTVYVICAKQHEKGVRQRITEWAEDDYRNPFCTKECVRLEGALREPDNKYMPRGWLELGNGYMFFVDREMYEGVCRMFGIALLTQIPIEPVFPHMDP